MDNGKLKIDDSHWSKQRYQGYKDSGVEWLGVVPEHWEVKRLKEVSIINQNTLSEKTPANYEFNYVDISSVTYGVKGYISEFMKFANAPSRAKRIVKKGDTIISTVRTYLKAITFIDSDVKDLIVSTGFAVISPKNKFSQKYFSFLLSSECIIDTICSLSTGVSYPAVNASIISDLLIPTPPLSKQEQIADYLDRKTTQIDRKINLLNQKANKYEELKKSLINETVTRGLDKSVAMKDSGIEWIGKIPKHWEVKRIKDISIINQNTLNEKTPDNYEFNYVDISSVTYGVKGYISERMKFANAPSRAKRIVKKGDTIISTVRTYLKAITFIDSDVKDLIVSTGFAVISPKNKFSSRYFSFLLTSEYIVDTICSLSTGVSYPAVNASIISDLLIPIPPLSEQKAIALYLDEKTAHCDKIITTINQQIEKLKELRKTLINDVVTGKIKVTE